MKENFEGIINIVLRIPEAQFDDMLTFYRDVLGMEMTEVEDDTDVLTSYLCQFGTNKLWLEKTDETELKRDIWLELLTDDMERSIYYLEGKGVKVEHEIDEDIDVPMVYDPVGLPFVLNE